MIMHVDTIAERTDVPGHAVTEGHAVPILDPVYIVTEITVRCDLVSATPPNLTVITVAISIHRPTANAVDHDQGRWKNSPEISHLISRSR